MKPLLIPFTGKPAEEGEFMWQEYAICPDSELTLNAKAMSDGMRVGYALCLSDDEPTRAKRGNEIMAFCEANQDRAQTIDQGWAIGLKSLEILALTLGMAVASSAFKQIYDNNEDGDEFTESQAFYEMLNWVWVA